MGLGVAYVESLTGEGSSCARKGFVCIESVMVICLRSEIGGRVRVWFGRGDPVGNDGLRDG